MTTLNSLLLKCAPGSAVKIARTIHAALPTPSGGDETNLLAAYTAARLPTDNYVPFRAPHHTVSQLGMIGSNQRTGTRRPGELALAHAGLLLLDELVEFRRPVIESIAGVVEKGEYGGFATRPAIIIATAWLCACGRTGTSQPCECSDAARGRHEDRVNEYANILGLKEVY